MADHSLATDELNGNPGRFERAEVGKGDNLGSASLNLKALTRAGTVGGADIEIGHGIVVTDVGDDDLAVGVRALAGRTDCTEPRRAEGLDNRHRRRRAHDGLDLDLFVGILLNAVEQYGGNDGADQDQRTGAVIGKGHALSARDFCGQLGGNIHSRSLGGNNRWPARRCVAVDAQAKGSIDPL